MDYTKPTLLVVSGPNGAGKSTHISSMIPDDFVGAVPFDRDKTRLSFEIQLASNAKMEAPQPETANMLMEKLLLQKITQAISAKKHFVLETPLSHPDYWQYIDRFINNGYQIQLNYLCLDKIKDCELRVQQRVAEGGHDVDARTIKGVYEMNLKYVNDYSDTFTLINLFDGTKIPELLATFQDSKVVWASAKALKKNWIKTGLPLLHTAIASFLS